MSAKGREHVVRWAGAAAGGGGDVFAVDREGERNKERQREFALYVEYHITPQA